jgi:hypothetical protein
MHDNGVRLWDSMVNGISETKPTWRITGEQLSQTTTTDITFGYEHDIIKIIKIGNKKNILN